MVIKKGYNNDTGWDLLEQEQAKASTKIINMEQQNISDAQTDEEFEAQEIEDAFKNDGEDFAEVLQLTQYTDGGLTPTRPSEFVIAEYEDINTQELSQKHKIVAKNFVAKITKFILDFNDVVLTEAHKTYIKQVGNLQVQHLEDLLLLTDVNKKMIDNIIHRVNATQAEDYAIINSYNNLINQHLKLMRELQNTYKSIPSVLKKMKADVLCNQALEEVNGSDEVITEDYGDTQFNNSKQMLRSLVSGYKPPMSAETEVKEKT